MRILSVLALLGVLLYGCHEAEQSTARSRAQSILETYRDSISGFGIVALIDDGHFRDTASIGYSFGQNRISTKNRFCIGSCTKMFTSVIILKLQEKGQLQIDDSIYHYLPHHPHIDSTITIRQLLNHSSGIADFLESGLMNASILNPEGDFSDRVIYENIDTSDFAKGTRYRYCNTNYFLLSEIIENITDKSWEMNLQELIIAPLQLKNTFPYYANTIEHLAHPVLEGVDYHSTPKRAINAISKGSGSIVSDVYDLNTFLRALLINKTLLNDSSLAAMTTYFDYKTTRSGLGMFEEKYGNRLMTGHTGRQLSYISYAFADLQTGRSILVLNNNMNDENIDRIFEKLCALD